MSHHHQIYVDGAWCDSSAGGTIDVIHSTTEEVMASVPAGNEQDVALAVAAARRAFDAAAGREHAASDRATRAAQLGAIADALEARADELSILIASEVGMPLPMTQAIQVAGPIAALRYFAKLVERYPFEEEIGHSLVVREPVGVVACITPWNFPLNQIVAKLAPALAVGCTVVLKPSEVAPLNAYVLAEAIDAAGLPPGVFNMVSGTGPVVGEALARHPEIDMVSFTGSTRAGRRVASLAAESIKRVALELGGKSANIILDDADLALAVKRGVANCYLNSGQTCSALTRMFVPRDSHDKAMALAKAAAEKFTVGDPLVGEARLGPLVSATQRERVRGYIDRGVEEGATLVTGGAEAPDGLARGFFVRPTVFGHVRNDMAIAQEEIFGPVLCILPYDGEQDAIRMANDSPYGLGGAVWSGDVERAERVARKMRTGQVDINGASFNPRAPFGGYKQSGYGRESGKFGLEEFLEVKSMQRELG
jgi:acyl-CoA reductase-like NAD-dependent aldehyde dehydrogenase